MSAAYQIFTLPKTNPITPSTVVLPGSKAYFYVTGTTALQNTYSDSALTTPNANPVVADASGVFSTIYLDPSLVYKLTLKTSADVLIYTVDPVNDQILSQALIGLFLYPRTAAEIAASITPSNYAIPSHAAVGDIIIERYGGVPGSGDNSTAFNNAKAVAVQLGGGEIKFTTVGEWRMNVTIAADNIKLIGPGGRSEFDVNSIRPFSIASAAITWGDDTNNYRYCGMYNLSVSGTNGTGGADVQSAKSAPYCVRVKGGMVGLIFDNCYLYNGIHTVHLEPSTTAPVTGFRMLHGGARNDLTDSANARTIYGVTKGSGLSNGYFTDNIFSHTKINGPGGPSATLGYMAEFYDGGGLGGIRGEFLNCYFDFRSDASTPATVCHGILLNGNASLSGFGVNLDTGSVGSVAVETTQALQDITRFLNGEFRHAGQKFKYAGGVVVDLPDEADWYFYKPLLNQPWFVGARGVSTVAGNPSYPTSVQWEMLSTTGPDRLTGASLECTKDIILWGGNASECGRLTAVGGSGGMYIAATGTNQNVRVVPTGTGQVVLEGAYTRPSGDNTQDCGGAGNRWKVVYAGTGAINTSDERVKDEIEDIPKEWLEAWGDVQWQRFKFKDSIAVKGDGARWHIGLIAQRVVKAFADRGLDATEIGLVCYEQWADEFEDVRETYEVEGKDGPITMARFTGEKRLVRPAGNLWSMRYEEALAMECAYLRHRLQLI